jgi:hypothetical protein
MPISDFLVETGFAEVPYTLHNCCKLCDFEFEFEEIFGIENQLSDIDDAVSRLDCLR